MVRPSTLLGPSRTSVTKGPRVLRPGRPRFDSCTDDGGGTSRIPVLLEHRTPGPHRDDLETCSRTESEHTSRTRSIRLSQGFLDEGRPT